MTISRRGRFFVPDTEERQGKETENLSLFLFSFCGFLEQSGNLFCQCHDGQNRRVAHCFRQDRGVRHVEIVRKPRMMQGVFFCPCQRQHAAGMAGIQGARKLLFFRDSHVDQDPSHQGDCLLHAAAVSFSHLLVDPLAADAAGFFIGQFDRFAKQNWNRRTQRYRHTMVRV